MSSPRRIASRTLLLLVGGGVAYLASVWVSLAVTANRPPEGDEANAPQVIDGVAIRAKHLNLGDLWEVDDYETTLVLENQRSTGVTIRSFATSCDCTSVEPKSLTIPAKQTREVKVRLNLTHRSPFQLGAEKRSLSVSLVPTFEDSGASRGGWLLSGTVQSRVVLDTHLLQFGTMCHRGGSRVTRKVTARLLEPGSTLAVRVEPPIAQAIVAKTTDPDAAAHEIRVTPNNDLPIGPYRFAVVTTVTDAAGGLHTGPTVSVSGEMRPNRMVWPSNVYFDERAIGTTVSADVTVDDGAEVRKIAHDSAELRVARKDGPGPKVYTITQRVTALGEQVTPVTFHLSQPDGSDAECVVTVRYVGVPAGGRE